MGSINPQGGTEAEPDSVGGGIGEGPGPDIMQRGRRRNKVMSADGAQWEHFRLCSTSGRTHRLTIAVPSEGGFLGMGS